MSNERAQADPELLEVRLKWTGIDELDILHANHMAIQSRGDYFLLTFGQSADPIVAAGDKAALDDLREKRYVPIRPLVRMAVSADDMRRFSEIIGKSVERFDETIEVTDGES